MLSSRKNRKEGMMNTLIIFDINGTIIQRDSRTDIPYSKSADELLNAYNAMKGIDTSARSDKDVFMEVLRNAGVVFEDRLWSKFLKIYEKNLELFKNTDIWRENAGSTDFINRLYNKGYPLTLMTGELRIGARFKLEKMGVWSLFPVGGFGEDALDRYSIAMKAVEKSRGYYARDFKEMVVIGDTVLDIKTARKIGAKSVSITTGSNRRNELEEYSPDLIIDDFYSLDIEMLF